MTTSTTPYHRRPRLDPVPLCKEEPLERDDEHHVRNIMASKLRLSTRLTQGHRWQLTLAIAVIRGSEDSSTDEDDDDIWIDEDDDGLDMNLPHSVIVRRPGSYHGM